MEKKTTAMQEIMTKAKYYMDNPDKNSFDVFDYEPITLYCGYCGDEMQSLSQNGFCSNNCWKGYEHETFRKD